MKYYCAPTFWLQLESEVLLKLHQTISQSFFHEEFDLDPSPGVKGSCYGASCLSKSRLPRLVTRDGQNQTNIVPEETVVTAA